MSRFHAVPYQDQSEINLSPMLDVVFIMLIFFIVVATFVDEQGLPVSLPQSPDRLPPEVESIQIRVEPAGVFVVNNRAMTAASVQPYVQALYAENPDADFAVLLSRGSIVRDTAVAIEAGRSIGVAVTPLQAIEGQ